MAMSVCCSENLNATHWTHAQAPTEPYCLRRFNPVGVQQEITNRTRSWNPSSFPIIKVLLTIAVRYREVVRNCTLKVL